MLENNKYYGIKLWLCAILIFVISFPIWFWNMSPLLMAYASILLLVLSYNDIVHNKQGKTIGILAVFFQIVIVGVAEILPSTNVFGILMVPIKGLGFATIFLCSVEFWKKVVDCFIKILALLLVVALVEHIMVCFMDIQLVSPYQSECPINPDRDYSVYLFNAYLNNSFELLRRFYAFYDEPGVLGNIMMVLLYIQRFNIKKWYNIVFLVSGILSFSLTFYIAVAVYFVLFGSVKSKVVFGVLVIVGVYYFYNNEFVYDMVFGRFEFEDGQMAGYNRENADFDYWISSKQWTEYFFWGYQPRYAVAYAASWKWAFALWGILPSLFYLFTIIYPRAKTLKSKKDLLAGLVLLTIIWIQRPFVYQFLYVFLIVIPFIYYNIPSRSDTLHKTL